MRARGAVRDRERGSLTPLLALVMVGVAGLCIGLGRLGGDAALAARASTAADAAALAGAAEGREAAEALAEANGARLVSFSTVGSEVAVEVEAGSHRASARAVGAALPRVGGGGASSAGMQPVLLAAIARAEAALGEPIPVVSGWRSAAQQQALWDNRASNPYPVAPPGRSKHEQGLAIDVPAAFAARLAAVGPGVGLCQPLPRTDPIHFEACPTPGA